MGLSAGALGRWVEAEAWIQEALTLPADAWVTANRRRIEADLGRVASHLGTLELTGHGPDAEVFLGAIRAGTWPTARRFRVAAGSIALRLVAPGHLAFTRPLNIIAGASVREFVELVPEAGLAPSTLAASTPVTLGRAETPDASPYRGRTLRALGWASVAMSIAGVGVGVLGYVLRERRVQDYNGDPVCGASAPVSANVRAGCATLLADVEEDVGTFNLLGPVGFVVGGVFAVTGGVLLGLGLSRPDRHERIALTCGAMGATPGVICGGQF